VPNFFINRLNYLLAGGVNNLWYTVDQ